MKIKGLYDGGILIFVGIFLIALGVATLGNGIKKVNKHQKKEFEKAEKSFVIPIPPTQEHKAPLPAKPIEPIQEQGDDEESVEYTVVQSHPTPSKEEPVSMKKPWYWPF